MKVYTDSPSFAAAILSRDVAGRLAPLDAPHADAVALIEALFAEGGTIWHVAAGGGPWRQLFLSEFSTGSQYDELIGLARARHTLPDHVAAVAGSGLAFHGFKGRSWAAIPGNVHLSVHLAPERVIERFEVAFTVLAALSVVDAVDTVPGLQGRAGIKWVNDILVDGAKVAGILAYTQARDTTVASVVLGIGVNVEATPVVDRNPFAPAVACLRESTLVPGAHERVGHAVRQGPLLEALLESLERNYRLLLAEGFRPLLDRYRERSLVVGREVTVCPEEPEWDPTVLAEGRVVRLGDRLELYLEGRQEPVQRGRIVLDRPIATAGSAAGHVRETPPTDT